MVTLKYVAVWLLEQWINLNEYFLVFLFFFWPKQRNFKKEIKDTKRYKTIEEGLQNWHAEAYLAFLACFSRFWSIPIKIPVW